MSMVAPLPSHAILCWVDDRSVYAAIPASDKGLPYIISYPLNESGLSKALNLLRIRYEELPSPMKNYTQAGREPTTRNGKPPVQTSAQRDAALAVLRKMGLV